MARAAAAGAQLFVYGVRHHGPGSARALLAALERDRPDTLAVEMPADLEAELHRIGDAALVPPVALVAYDPQAVTRALYYPLARFSPEWVAMRWAAERGVRIVPVDLPAGVMTALAEERTLRLQAPPGAPDDSTRRAVALDPLGELARLAGYTDRERWWERTFELQSGTPAIFPAVSAMVAALREAYPEATDAECALREAHMARALLALQRGGARRLGVVCGAWHAPVLERAALRKTASEYKRLRGSVRATRLAVTWIPWTYARLRSGAGYGAGVVSPVWYELLHDDPGAAAAGYLTLAARALRARGLSGSTAQVIDAIALAEALRDLRGLALAGLEEIEAAALGSLAEGSEARLALVREDVQRLGTAGRVPDAFTNLPLLRDLQERLKATRLTKPYRNREATHRALDLRKPAHLLASQLLHQMLLLGIPFGQRHAVKESARGTFREEWTLHWHPEFALRLLAAHVDGQTIREVAIARLRRRTEAPEVDLPTLTGAVDELILAGLFGELDGLAHRIRDRVAETVDVWIVARALPPLVNLARYRSLRLREATYLRALIANLVPKLATGLRAAAAGLDDEQAYAAFGVLKRVHPYLTMVGEAALVATWYRGLEEGAFARATHPLLGGFAVRALGDADVIPAARTAQVLRADLGRGVELRRASLFVEGFLYSSALVLLHQPTVFAAIDAWVDSLEADEFRGLLPALRRTFAQFPPQERRKLWALLLRAPGAGANANSPDTDPLGDSDPPASAPATELTDGLEAQLDEWLG